MLKKGRKQKDSNRKQERSNSDQCDQVTFYYF